MHVINTTDNFHTHFHSRCRPKFFLYKDSLSLNSSLKSKALHLLQAFASAGRERNSSVNTVLLNKSDVTAAINISEKMKYYLPKK